MKEQDIEINQVKQAALSLAQRGLRIVLCDGKSPIGKNWQSKVYSPEVIESEFTLTPSLNVGVVLGPTSQITDVEGDHEQSEMDFLELFEGEEPRTWKFQSKRGVHRLFKYDPQLAALNKANAKWRTLEIRGCNDKASQTVFPPSTSDDFTRHWIVSPDECELASLPEAVIRKLVPPEPSDTIIGKEGRPGDDFNANGPKWSELLQPYGWTYAGNDGDKTSYWRRPGKTQGISATTGHLRTENGQELLYVFSSNAPPLEASKAYTKFSAFAVLNHAGDFSAAASALAAEGYGKPDKPSKKGSGPSAATRMISMLARDPAVELFHTPEDEPYATVPYDARPGTHDVTAVPGCNRRFLT